MPTYRDHYYPNTEALAKHEMRVTALGTGRPFLRPAQANASWLIELGNGDKFMFDFGFGSQMNFSGLEIPYADMTAYFATHLHTDHVGDFAQIWVGSWTGGRLKPLKSRRFGWRFIHYRDLDRLCSCISSWILDSKRNSNGFGGNKSNDFARDSLSIKVDAIGIIQVPNVFDHTLAVIAGVPTIEGNLRTLTNGHIFRRNLSLGRQYIAQPKN